MIRNCLRTAAVFGCIASFASADELRVKDVPIADGASNVTFMKRRGDVRYQVASDFKAVGQFYAQKLVEQGWTRAAKQNLQRSFWVQSFSKGAASLEVRVDSRGGGSEVRLTPTGMMWEEDDQPTPKDLPIPEKVTDLEYDDFFESIEFKSPSNVKTVAEFYEQELVKRRWTKDAAGVDTAGFVRLKFAQQKSTLEIDVRAEGEGCEVSIRTKGMQWDGMKAEIARAKEKAAEVAAAAKSMPTAPGTAVALPQRKDKPKQGIDQLPKLPNEAAVTMDGKSYKLTHIIAFEAFENGEWLTKIVATQKPVKLDTLLARLKQFGTDKNQDGISPAWPQPHVQVVLEADDRPWRISLSADGTPGGGTGNEVTGTALVENGRARGTVKLKEPGKFFDKVYTAEISFDVNVLTRESAPTKLLAEAPKLATSGKLTIGGKIYTLNNVTAYRTRGSSGPQTTVVLSVRPLNTAKLTAALAKNPDEDYFEFIPQIQLRIDADDNVSSVFLWADGISISGNSNVGSDIVVEDGRARGTARSTKSEEFGGGKHEFTVSFDATVLAP